MRESGGEARERVHWAGASQYGMGIRDSGPVGREVVFFLDKGVGAADEQVKSARARQYGVGVCCDGAQMWPAFLCWKRQRNGASALSNTQDLTNTM